MSFDGLPGLPQHVLPTVLSRPIEPVFVDATGIRRRRIRRAGVLLAVASLSYLPMAATALLPGPAAPAQPAPLFVGDPGGGTGEQLHAAPSPLADPYPNLTPEPEDTMDGPEPPADPAPDDSAPITVPSTKPPEPEPSPPTDVLPTGRPSATPVPPTSPPAPLPEGSTPPVTASPTMSTPAEPSPEPAATRPITLELAPWVAG